jgi:hypothetical protein
MTTEFKSETTNHNANPNGDTPKLMSEPGKRMASHTAPSNAYQVTTGSTSAVKEK